MKDDLANEDLAHLRALTEPKDDMLKRETPLPKGSPVCPVCGLDRPHGHGQAELVSIIRELKADLAAAQESLALEKSFVHALNGLHAGDIETLKRDLAAAQAEVIAANTRADAMFRVAEKHEAEAAALRVDAERYRYIRQHAHGEKYGLTSQCFVFDWPEPKANIMRGSVAQHLDAAIDQARKEGE